MASISINTGYAKSVRGILKVLEIIAMCVAYACLVEFDRDIYGGRGGKYGPRFEFFMVAFVIGWVVVLFVYFVFLLTMEAKITTEKNWNLFLLIFSGLFALLCLIASSLMADYLNDLYKHRWHQVYYLKYYVRTLTVSVVFGFLSFVLLAVDGYLAFTKVKG